MVAARVQMKSIKSALETMRLDINRYPSQEEGLQLLTHTTSDQAANWSGPYLSGAVPKDPWGRDYIYIPPTADHSEPTIKTLGADGKAGGAGNDADIEE